MKRSCRLASSCIFFRLVVFMLCSCMNIPAIGENLFSELILWNRALRLLVSFSPFGFQHKSLGPGWGSMPSSVRSRIHMGHGRVVSGCARVPILSCLYLVRVLGLGWEVLVLGRVSSRRGCRCWRGRAWRWPRCGPASRAWSCAAPGPSGRCTCSGSWLPPRHPCVW